MKKVSLLILVLCSLTIVNSWIIADGVSNLKKGIRSAKNYVTSFDPSKLNFSYLKEHINLPNIDFINVESLPQIPAINKVGQMVNGVIEIPKDVANKVKEKLTDFLSKQISMFSNVSLSIYDDFENVVPFKLELPDLNVLNLFSDLNKKVTIKLFTKETGLNSEILAIDDKKSLEKSHFDPKRNTYIMTHGFMSSCEGVSCSLIRDALLKTTDSNVITVDWYPLSKGGYVTARLFVPRIGAHIGKFLNFLYENGLDPDKTILIGHSLGAQTMGFAGQTSNKKVKTIIGLDPAWPLFVFVPENERLSPDDAQHVVVLHTNGGLLGVPFVSGHLDFYPNGGLYQIGCVSQLFDACSHGRSYKYLAEEITNPGPDFFAKKCNSYTDFRQQKCSGEEAIMGGINFAKEKPGEYYLDTNEVAPFSLGKRGLLPV